MNQLINSISARCYTAAVRRGKSVGFIGCAEAIGQELKEYWQAVDTYRQTQADEVNKAIYMADNDNFMQYYDMYIHNTDFDELADLMITAATWMETAKQNNEDYNPERNIDAVLANGAIAFVIGRIQGASDALLLRTVINLKMRYNDLRED
jgi:sugar/nucleoside kinase (ribokinase family)